MNWQTMTHMAVGKDRHADGEWRVVEDEFEIKLEIKTNGMVEASPGCHTTIGA